MEIRVWENVIVLCITLGIYILSQFYNKRSKAIGSEDLGN